MQDYHRADIYIHHLAQIITKVNRTYLAAKEDDSHTNLYFDALQQRLLGQWIKTNGQKHMFCLNLKQLHFEWLNDQFEVVASIAVVGFSVDEIESNIAQRLPEIGLSEIGFREALHFEIPVYFTADTKMIALHKKELNLWMQYRSMANNICYDILGMLQVAGDVRIWPHHFDTGIYVIPNENMTLSFGLAMKDQMVNHPYFYFSITPTNPDWVKYDAVPSLDFGTWKVDSEWMGAVLPLSEIMPGDYMELKGFVKQVFGWYNDQVLTNKK